MAEARRIHHFERRLCNPGGGLGSAPDGYFTQVTPDSPVTNEPGISNLRGTIGLAKVGGDPNSGTTNWFFNLGDNSFLDLPENNEFTAFGRVAHDGMDIIDAIYGMRVFPLYDQSSQQIATSVPMHGDFTGDITRDNFVLFTSIEELNIPDGDYDFDGDVDMADLMILQRTFGSTTDGAADGNGNGVVDAGDMAIWQQTFGQSTVAGAVAAVPEPSTLACLTVGLLVLPRRRTRR